ncbi:hypothetical protein Vadar_023898 [Vaccinium darrowii]|uniref:Uncharacterized protein n=1 Tax=Vaccinium darrowii TaxID=229202 RepID=A0ACB7Z641_9ERIC|nr:hypothetical protein Vadar_023898 [Vaccinium darrowii]
MVRNSYRVPLTFLDWQCVPDHIKEDIWKEVKDNLEDCPDEYKSVCMDNCCRIYKDNKGKIKDKHYKPYMVPNPDPNITSKCPDFIDPAANGESLDKMGVHLKTQRQDDLDVIEIVDLLSEDERTIEARDRIFHSIVGEDDHGYCRTYGGGVRHSSVYKKDPRPSQINNPLPMAEMEQQVVAH